VRARNVRLVVSLVVASLLATVLLYTAFGQSVRVVQVTDLLHGRVAGNLRLNGVVLRHSGDASAPGGMRIVLGDNARRPGSVVVDYHGSVPDAFQNQRSILFDGRLKNGQFVAQRDSLSTKCPSKYQASPLEPKQHA
jgi:cytochrome c-type biogenesis protein CcmE